MITKQLFRVAVLLSLFAAAACQNAGAPCLPDVEYPDRECAPVDPAEGDQ